MKRILLIGPFPDPITGLSLSNKVIYNGLCDLNYDVSRVNFSYNKFEENVGKFSFGKALFFLKVNGQILKILNRDSIVITIGQSFFGVIKYSAFIFLSIIFNKEIIIHLHGSMLGDMYNDLLPIKKAIVKNILKKASKAIVLAPSHKSIFEPFINKKKIYVLPNFVEQSLAEKLKDMKVENYRRPKIIFLSNLMTEKGVFYLLDALKILNDKGFIFEAKLAGNIDLKNRKKILTKISETKNIEYLGVVNGHQKRELLVWGNIFIFPSYLKEGFPLSILEAMLFRNVIISTKHSALMDFFDDRSIIFIDEQSSNSIVKAIEMVNNSIKSLQDVLIQNQKVVMNRFSEEMFIKNFIDIVND